MAGPAGKVHPGRRHNNPMMHKNGKPRLKPLNITQLSALVEKTQRKKDKAKITREIARKQARLAV